MAKGYWIARVDVTDPEGYKEYVALNQDPRLQYEFLGLDAVGTDH